MSFSSASGIDEGPEINAENMMRIVAGRSNIFCLKAYVGLELMADSSMGLSGGGEKGRSSWR